MLFLCFISYSQYLLAQFEIIGYICHLLYGMSLVYAVFHFLQDVILSLFFPYNFVQYLNLKFFYCSFLYISSFSELSVGRLDLESSSDFIELHILGYFLLLGCYCAAFSKYLDCVLLAYFQTFFFCPDFLCLFNFDSTCRSFSQCGVLSQNGASAAVLRDHVHLTTPDSSELLHVSPMHRLLVRIGRIPPSFSCYFKLAHHSFNLVLTTVLGALFLRRFSCPLVSLCFFTHRGCYSIRLVVSVGFFSFFK